MAKPWYMRNIEIGPDRSLPVSPVSVAVLFLSVFYLLYYWSGKPVYAVASHILLEKDPEGEEKLEAWKEKIGKDAALFAKYARAHSSCPSKGNGGNLGRFPRGAMTPKFDVICFDPNTPVNTAVGPIHTQFGWHLIYIHERQLSK
jgi:peptidyl-prolyl cis-trans isomerase C